jgi:hypothetical protein
MSAEVSSSREILWGEARVWPIFRLRAAPKLHYSIRHPVKPCRSRPGIRIQTLTRVGHLSLHGRPLYVDGTSGCLAGERDFRDFSRLPPVHENRA